LAGAGAPNAKVGLSALGAVVLADDDVVVAPNLKPPLLETTGVVFGLISATGLGLLSTGLAEVVSTLAAADAPNPPNFGAVVTEAAALDVVVELGVADVVALLSSLGFGAPNLNRELAALPYLKLPLSASFLVELDEVSSASFSDCGTVLVEGEANLNLDDEEIPNLIAGDEVDFESAFVFTSDDALVVVAAGVDNPNLMEDGAGADVLAGGAGVDADIPNLIADEAVPEVSPGPNKDDELLAGAGADPGLGFSQQTHLSAVLGTMHTSHVQFVLAGAGGAAAGTAAGADADIPNVTDEAGAEEVMPGPNKDDELFARAGADPGLGFSQQTHLSAVLGTMHTSHVQFVLAGGFAGAAGAADTELVVTTVVLLGVSSGLLEAMIPVVLGFGLGTPSPKAPVDFSVFLAFFEDTSPLSFTSSFFTEELFPPRF